MTKEYQRELEEKGILPILTEEEDKALWEGLKATREKCLAEQKAKKTDKKGIEKN